MSAYLCPLCQQPLQQVNNQYKCRDNHSFDFAKEGYVNLLPVQFKKSKDPGDNKEMVVARRAFLEKGHYAFLQQAIVDVINTYQTQGTLIDLGCGEGFYTHKIAEEHASLNVFGIDISKSAVKYAAKRYKTCQFSVASISNAPFGMGSADILVSVFAPLFNYELLRLAKPGGYLVAVTPARNHLQQLKQFIYRDVRPHDAIETPAGFDLLERKMLTKTVSLSHLDLKSLIMMTPFAWKFRPEHWQQIEKLNNLDIDFEFYINIFQKKES